MNTETKIFLISNEDGNDVEIERLEFLDCISSPALYLELDVCVGIDNLNYLTVLIDYGASIKSWSILNCDIYLLIKILRTKTKKRISNEVLTLLKNNKIK